MWEDTAQHCRLRFIPRPRLCWVTLKTRNRPRCGFCVSLEVEHSFPSVGCVRNKLQSHTLGFGYWSVTFFIESTQHQGKLVRPLEWWSKELNRLEQALFFESPWKSHLHPHRPCFARLFHFHNTHLLYCFPRTVVIPSITSWKTVCSIDWTKSSHSAGKPVAINQQHQFIPSSSSSAIMPINQRKWNDISAVGRIDDAAYIQDLEADDTDFCDIKIILEKMME